MGIGGTEPVPSDKTLGHSLVLGVIRALVYLLFISIKHLSLNTALKQCKERFIKYSNFALPSFECRKCFITCSGLLRNHVQLLIY